MISLIENTRAFKLLQSEGEKSRFSHAYLLQFDDSRNLKTALKAFAKLLFGCTEQAVAYSEKHRRIASLIDGEKFSDCLFYPKDGEKFLVEDAEKIAEECMLQPVESEIKAFVIGDFASATAVAQNKLLKLLEEPPKGVIFLLGTTSVFPVLSTVLSRVEKLEIPPFEIEQISDCLAREYPSGYTRTDFELCAAASGGSVGTAQSILEGGDFHTLLSDAFSLCIAKPHELPSLIKRTGESKRKKEFLSLLRIIFRDALLLKKDGEKASVFLRSEKKNLTLICENYPLSTLLFSQACISEAEQQLFFNTVFSQCLEILFSKIYQHKEKLW